MVNNERLVGAFGDRSICSALLGCDDPHIAWVIVGALLRRFICGTPPSWRSPKAVDTSSTSSSSNSSSLPASSAARGVTDISPPADPGRCGLALPDICEASNVVSWGQEGWLNPLSPLSSSVAVHVLEAGWIYLVVPARPNSAKVCGTTGLVGREWGMKCSAESEDKDNPEKRADDPVPPRYLCKACCCCCKEKGLKGMGYTSISSNLRPGRFIVYWTQCVGVTGNTFKYVYFVFQ